MVKLFGSTIKETASAFKSTNFGNNKDAGTKEDRTKAIGRIIVSVLLLFLCTYFFTTGTNKETASTILGALIGYWIK